MTTLFDKPVTQDHGDDFDTLIQERFTNDDGTLNVDELKKSWAHSQKHIKTVERDNATVREEVIRRLSYEDLLEKLKNNPDASRATPQDGVENDGNQNGQNVDVDALRKEARLAAREEYTQIQQSTIESDNRAFVISKLREAWGTDYVARLEEETKILGKSKEYMNALASQDPAIVLRLLGADKAPTTRVPNITPPRSSISSRGGLKMKSKYEEYQEVKKSDKRRYDSPAFQMEMLRVADEMGDKFYQKG